MKTAIKAMGAGIAAVALGSSVAPAVAYEGQTYAHNIYSSKVYYGWTAVYYTCFGPGPFSNGYPVAGSRGEWSVDCAGAGTGSPAKRNSGASGVVFGSGLPDCHVLQLASPDSGNPLR